jgi:hypothetical protein
MGMIWTISGRQDSAYGSRFDVLSDLVGVNRELSHAQFLAETDLGA